MDLLEQFEFLVSSCKMILVNFLTIYQNDYILLPNDQYIIYVYIYI